MLELGFADISVQESHAGFRHEDGETFILLAVHEPGEHACMADVKYVRRVLDERGLLESNAFDDWIASGKMPAAG